MFSFRLLLCVLLAFLASAVCQDVPLLHPLPSFPSLYQSPSSPHDTRHLFTHLTHGQAQLRSAAEPAATSDSALRVAVEASEPTSWYDVLTSISGLSVSDRVTTGHATSAVELSANASAAAYVVSMKSPTALRHQQLLANSIAPTGYTTLAYLPHNSFLVAPDAEDANETALVEWSLSSPHVQLLRRFEPSNKIDPLIAQQLAWAEEDQRQAHYDIVRAANATGDAEDEEDDSQLWTLAVSLFPSAHYPKAQRLVEQWAAHFAAANLSGVTVEGWGPSTIGVSIAESAMQPPPSVSSTVLSVVDFLAAQPAVEWIGTAAVFDTANKHASSISQSGVFGPPSRPLWERNLTGAGQVVSIGDTGVAWSSCFFHDPEVPVPFNRVDHSHRKLVSYFAVRNKTHDLKNGHGTHTAGSIAGKVLLSAPSDDSSALLSSLSEYDGMAPDAKLVIFDFNDGRTRTKIKTPHDITAGFFLPSYTAGARISSNSWGARNGTYIRESRDMDAFVHAHPDFLPVFASGNYGQKGFQTVVAPSSAKNTLSIGAVRSSRMKEGGDGKVDWCGSETDDDDPSVDRVLSFFSGRGPTTDLRVKPDVVVPGEWIVSARSSGDPSAVGCSTCRDALLPLFGTSMATAIAAGTAALVRQYFTDGFYPGGAKNAATAMQPSAALVKAVMIAAAVPDVTDPMDAQSGRAADSYAPRPGVGFGRVELNSALSFQDDDATPDLYVVDRRDIASGELHAHCFFTRDASLPFRATLAWSDPPAHLSSSWLLVHDLDLSLRSNASAELLLVNDHRAADGQRLWDVTNTVEQITTPLPASTLVAVHVRGTHIPMQPTQPYSLVVTGHFYDAEPALCAALTDCAGGCGGHGSCGVRSGLCECDEGWTGAGCGVGSERLESCDERHATVPFGEWRFYHIEPRNDSVLWHGQWSINMRSLAGDPDLYLHVGRFPSLTDFNRSNPSTSTEHALTWSASGHERVYIGVFGYCCAESEFTLHVAAGPCSNVEKHDQ